MFFEDIMQWQQMVFSVFKKEEKQPLNILLRPHLRPIKQQHPVCFGTLIVIDKCGRYLMPAPYVTIRAFVLNMPSQKNTAKFHGHCVDAG